MIKKTKTVTLASYRETAYREFSMDKRDLTATEAAAVAAQYPMFCAETLGEWIAKSKAVHPTVRFNMTVESESLDSDYYNDSYTIAPCELRLTPHYEKDLTAKELEKVESAAERAAKKKNTTKAKLEKAERATLKRLLKKYDV